MILSVLFNKRESKTLREKTQTQGEIRKTAFRQAQVQTYPTHSKAESHRKHDIENSNVGLILVKWHEVEVI